MSADTVSVYGLVDPRDGLIHYVGRTSAALQTRLRAHKYDISSSGKSRSYGLDKIRWMKELRELGLSPKIKLLEEVSESESLAAEKRWVQQLFRAGVPLTNRQWRPRAYSDVPDWLRGYAAALLDVVRCECVDVRGVMEAGGIGIEKFEQVLEEGDLMELMRRIGRRRVRR